MDKRLEHPVIKIAKREVSITKSRETRTGLPYVTLPVDHVVYLIQQAELYQECAADATKLYEENQRYEQALEEINFQASLDETSDNVQEAIDKALEGENNG